MGTSTAKKSAGKKAARPAQGMDLHKSLHQYFGFKKFKGTQEQAIESLLAGHDTFVIMPTGGGKSLCYQLPAMISEGVNRLVAKGAERLKIGYESEAAGALYTGLGFVTGPYSTWYASPRTAG